MACARALCPATTQILYANLDSLYKPYNYPASYIWSCDESNVKTKRFGGSTMLLKQGSRSAYSIEPNHKEHLSVLSCCKRRWRLHFEFLHFEVHLLSWRTFI